MKPIFQLLLFISVLAWTSCDKNDDPYINESDLLLGYWDNSVPVDTMLRYERTAGLKENTYGFAVKAGHVFVERKIDGWCGTPPVTYYDYQGTWSRQDSVVDVDVAYWGGTVHYQWKIVSLDEKFLTIAFIKVQYSD